MMRLLGTTWNHTRGYAPLAATAEAYRLDHPEVNIQWEKRSLQDLADFPIEALAESHDLVVIDHPSVGAAAHSQCFLPMEELLPAESLTALAEQSVGRSHLSYHYNGHQWAVAIDAASHVSAYRPDLLKNLGIPVPKTWVEVLALARELSRSGKTALAIPLIPVDSLMCFYTLCASSGEDPFSKDARRVVSQENGLQALDMLSQVLPLSHPESLAWNPVNVLDRMSSTDEVAYCPWLFGYSNYSRQAYSAFQCHFTNIPTFNGGVPRGAILGGTGLAISTKCQYPQIAADYARYVSSADCQRSIYFESGGQPGNIAAWHDPVVNQASSDFFTNTMDTLVHAYMRPRYSGYIHFQTQAALIVHEFLRNRGNPSGVLEALNRLYLETMESTLSSKGTGVK
jgi:multiple sugar transport system substrate-binding protein